MLIEIGTDIDTDTNDTIIKVVLICIDIHVLAAVSITISESIPIYN